MLGAHHVPTWAFADWEPIYNAPFEKDSIDPRGVAHGATRGAAISVLLLGRPLMMMSPQWSAVAHNPQAEIGKRTTSWHPSHSKRLKRILVG